MAMLCVVLRALAEAKIKWAFWPPGVSLPAEDHREELGIWLGNAVEGEEDENCSDFESIGTLSSEEDAEKETSVTSEEVERELEEEEEEEGRNGETRVMGVGRFGALSIDDGNDSDTL